MTAERHQVWEVRPEPAQPGRARVWPGANEDARRSAAAEQAKRRLRRAEWVGGSASGRRRLGGRKEICIHKAVALDCVAAHDFDATRDAVVCKHGARADEGVELAA